jgi:uncharacterized protein
MPTDHIRYDLLAQEALRGVVQRILADVAKNGLPGEHHFYISFDTRAPGVRISPRLREKYAEEMTIVLQHQFWDLIVAEDAFEVGLSFNGVPERLAVPFEAIKGFVDPSVQFALQFETIAEEGSPAERPPDAAARPPLPVPAEAQDVKSRRKPRKAVPAPTAPTPSQQDVAEKPAETSEPPGSPSGGAEVVRLDRFRKK